MVHNYPGTLEASAVDLVIPGQKISFLIIIQLKNSM
jgi:hypothetical protein